MNVPIRMISVATSLFWVFIIAFTASVVYSMKDVRLDFGRLQAEVGSDDELHVILPIVVTNKGYYDIDYFNVSTVLEGKQGVIGQGFTFIPIVRKGQTLNTTHQMKVNLTDLFQNYESLIFNDSELQMNTTVRMNTANWMPVQISSNLTIPWGAPFYNFTIGTPNFLPQSGASLGTYYRIVVPISFENHAQFDFAGTFRLRMYNSTNMPIGNGETTFVAPHGSAFKGHLEMEVPASGVSGNGHFEVLLATPFFNYGPLVVRYGV